MALLFIAPVQIPTSSVLLHALPVASPLEPFINGGEFPGVFLEGRQHLRVEMAGHGPAVALDDDGAGSGVVKGGFVHPGVAQGVVLVGKVHDPAGGGNLFADQPVGIAAAIPPFMVRQGDLRRHPAADRQTDGAMQTLDVARVSLSSQCLGASKEMLDLSIKHANERKQFGKPIAEQQAIQFMLADMAAEIYQVESILYRTAWMIDNGMSCSRESAICKLVATEVVCRVADRAMQIHGGMGYMREFPIERFYRDARVNRIFEGTNEIQHLIIARQL